MSEHIIRQIPRPKPERVVTPRKSAAAPTLTAEYLRSILNYDQETGIFTWKVSTANSVKVGDVAGSPDGRGYLHIMVQKRDYKAHRLAWLYMHGEWPKLNIDHINRNPSDNRISNLRDVTQKQNGQNRSTNSDNKSGHPGVSWNKRLAKWVAQITHNYKDIHLGCFTDKEEANAARKAGELKYWGAHRAE